MNAFTSCERLWRKRLNELSSVWPDFVGGRTAALHKTRVASRRIREALPVVGVGASPAKVRKLNRKMRALTRSLGPIRELDVELGLLDRDLKADGVSGRAIEIVRREIASQRQVLRRDLAENTPVGDVQKLIRKLERVGNAEAPTGKKGHHQETAWRGVLSARLLRRAKTLRAALDEAGPLYAPDRIHDVRIAIKKLRYALEIAHDAGVPRAGALVRKLKKHQELLGRLHDLQMLLKHVRQAEVSSSSGSRTSDLTTYADSLERDCRRFHAAFVERRTELVDCVKEVRQQLVPSLTTPPRRQVHVASAARETTSTRRRVK